MVARFRARLTAAAGDTETAGEQFDAAVRILRQITSPYRLGTVLLEQAETLIGAGRDDEAAPMLDEARTIFEGLQAAPALQRLEAVAAGLAPPSSVVPA